MFNNLTEIKEQLNLKSLSKEDLRKELKLKLKECHPDSNGGGDFESVEKRLLFEKIKAAIDFIDTPLELVLRREISDLKKLVEDLAIKRNYDEVLIKKEELLTSKIETSIKKYSSTHLFPKITSSVIAGLLSIIWIFPNTVSEHMILKKFIDVQSLSFTIIWFASLLFTVWIWMLFNALERRNEDDNNSLKLESVQNMLFDEFIKWRHTISSRVDPIVFTKEDFIDFIRNFNLSFKEYQPERRNPFLRLRFLLDGSKIDVELAQDLSEIILNRMKSKELVKVITQKTISDIFIFQPEAMRKDYYNQHMV